MLGPDRPVFKLKAAGPKHVGPAGSLDHVLAVRQFVARVGGIDNARRALEVFKLLKRAA